MKGAISEDVVYYLPVCPSLFVLSATSNATRAAGTKHPLATRRVRTADAESQTCSAIGAAHIVSVYRCDTLVECVMCGGAAEIRAKKVSEAHNDQLVHDDDGTCHSQLTYAKTAVEYRSLAKDVFTNTTFLMLTCSRPPSSFSLPASLRSVPSTSSSASPCRRPSLEYYSVMFI